MNLRPLLIVPPLVLGVLGYMWINRPAEVPSTPQEPVPQTVRAITIERAPLLVTATGFGRVEPVRSWSAVSQVDGRVVETAPGLALGTVVEAGALLVQIDPKDYELAVAKAEANLASAKASLLELERQEENSRTSLEIEERVYEVAKAEYQRAQELAQRGTTSSATLDTAQKTLLNQETAVVSLTNTLALFPAQRASAEATLAVRDAELTEARRNLENTVIVAPYRGRVSMEAIEKGQFVRSGNELVTLDGIASAEINGAFQPRDFASVAGAALGSAFAATNDIDVTQVMNLLNASGVSAFVEVQFAQQTVRYPAELERLRGTMDSETGTLGVVVRVDDPLVVNRQEDRPPLEFNSFVSVVLETVTQESVVAIPRAALRQGDAGLQYVYAATPEDTLQIVPVMPVMVTGASVVIAQGLEDGDRVLMSSPRPAISGMPLTVLAADPKQ